MRAGLSAAWAFARCNGALGLIVGAAACVAASFVLPLDPVLVPGRPDVRSVIWPLVPTFAALAVPAGAAGRFRTWEHIAARPARWSRAAFLAMLALQVASVVVLVPLDRWVVARNLVLFDGVALMAVAFSRRPTWSALVAIPVVCWLVGVDPPDQIRAWAIPLRPVHDAPAAVAAIGAVVGGMVAHLFAPADRSGDAAA